ncbi:MAG: bacteriohemerythrin [Rhodoferax sp.]
MGLKKSTDEIVPSRALAGHGHVDYQVEGRILHTSVSGPLSSERIAALPATNNELILRLVQQGKWGQIVVFRTNALSTASTMAEFGVYLKQRYRDPQIRPFTALVFGASLVDGAAMAERYLQCYQEAAIECCSFEDYQAALHWVESRIGEPFANFAWNDSYRIGDALIDEQHQELFRRAAFVLAATSHEGQAVCAMRLYQYMRTHLSHEEDLMRRIGYPEIDLHTRQHEQLLAKLHQISFDIANENLVKAELEDFIANWFLTHIADEDSQLAAYIT